MKALLFAAALLLSPPAAEPSRILFIGNSLTYQNDLPGMVCLLARSVDAILLPVGDAWQAAWAIERDLPLYAADNFHPSGVGTYLAALVMYRHLMGAPAPATPVLGGAVPHVELLQRVASLSGLRNQR